MKTRHELTTDWALLLDIAQPPLEKPAHLAHVQELLDSTVNKLTDSWPDPVKSMRNAPPASPATGDRYAVGPVGTGAWGGRSNQLAWWDGTAWRFSTPPNGALVMCQDDATVAYLRRNGELVPLRLPTHLRYRTTGGTPTASTTPVELAALAAPLKAGRNYRIEVELLLACSNAAEGVVLGLLGPGSTTVAATVRIPDAPAGEVVAHAAAFGPALAASASAPGAGTPFTATLRAVVVAPANTDWATPTVASTNAASTVTVLAGSTITVTDITD